MIKNIYRGSYLLWSIICSLSNELELRRLLVENGCVRLISLGFDISGSQKANQILLLTLKNLSKDTKMEGYSSGEKVLGNLLKMIETSSHSNMLIIIEILSYTATAIKSESGLKANSKLLEKILDMGIHSDYTIKFTVLKVLSQLFQKGSQLIGKLNSDRIAALIYTAFISGEITVKETASEVLNHMIRRSIVDLNKEPDLVYQIIINCTDPKSERVRLMSIDILYNMTMSVNYLQIILLNSGQITSALKSSLSLLHSEIAKGLYQSHFILFDKMNIENGSSGYQHVMDDDLVTHIGSLEEMKTRFILENKRIKEMKKYDKKREEERDDDFLNSGDENDLNSEERDIRTEKLVHNRSNAFSEMSFPTNYADDDKKILMVVRDIVSDSEASEKIQKAVENAVIDNTSVLSATSKIVKIVNVMLSCDIIYSKVMSYNFQALFGMLIEKSIGNRVRNRKMF